MVLQANICINILKNIFLNEFEYHVVLKISECQASKTCEIRLK